MLHWLTRAHELPQAGSPLTGSSFSAPAERGTRTAAGRFAPDGRLLLLRRLTGAHELPQAGSTLTGGEFFAEPQRGAALCGARGFAAPAAGAKRKDNLRFSFLFELLPFPCFLIWRRLPTCDRFEIRGTAEDCFFRVFRNLFAVSDTALLHIWVSLRRRGITVPRNS